GRGPAALARPRRRSARDATRRAAPRALWDRRAVRTLFRSARPARDLARRAEAPGDAPLLKARQKLGKYRIVRRIARGGFAEVYEARDTVEGIRVALKIPHAEHVTPEALETFKKEVRLVARLDHPGILPIKTAGPVDGRFVIAQ